MSVKESAEAFFSRPAPHAPERRGEPERRTRIRLSGPRSALHQKGISGIGDPVYCRNVIAVRLHHLESAEVVRFGGSELVVRISTLWREVGKILVAALRRLPCS
jgi:hypothetical protein